MYLRISIFLYIFILLLLHLIHSVQFPTIKLQDDSVQPGALTKRFYPWSLSVSLDLRFSICPLFVDGSLISLSSHTFLLLRNQLQLQDITVLRRIMSQIRQKEEITETMIQL